MCFFKGHRHIWKNLFIVSLRQYIFKTSYFYPLINGYQIKFFLVMFIKNTKSQIRWNIFDKTYCEIPKNCTQILPITILFAKFKAF